MSRRITPPKLAKLWGVSPDKITSLIKSGLLEAIDLASPGSKRPRFSISEQSIAAFEARRSVVPTTKRPQKTEGRAKRAKVTEYF